MTETLSKPSGPEMEGNPISQDVEKVRKKELKPVATGKVSKKRQSSAKRFRESLGLEETRTVGDYLIWDVLIPAFKETLADVVTKGINVFLDGGAGPSRPIRHESRSRVSYEGYYSKNRNRDYKDARAESRRYYGMRPGSDIREFVFEDRRDAETILSEMCEIIDTYGFVKLSDFYSAVGESERNWNDHGYGWDALGSASIERVRDGWVLDLPRPIPLN